MRLLQKYGFAVAIIAMLAVSSAGAEVTACAGGQQAVNGSSEIAACFEAEDSANMPLTRVRAGSFTPVSRDTFCPATDDGMRVLTSLAFVEPAGCHSDISG